MSSTLHEEMYLANGEFDSSDFLLEEDLFDIFAPSLFFEPPIIALPTPQNAAFSGATPNEPEEPFDFSTNATPRQTIGPSTHTPPSQRPTTQMHRHTCGINSCTKSYKRRSDLQRHQLSHSPSKDYACRFGLCPRAGRNGFKRKDHLKQHLRQVHGVSQ
ncbi:hypothetical protein L207DRAFT_267390 [Hyaloscypha variabilis F]|uniref:C2H2-type domain-containing protein n=1 Tax=Hyaloscypha variabilis (strain UAMH 11265 / GT02V1 / F) TaxID=1149755 RepID=A0A2J6RZH6_HYAVF|nr:hypothetical protein L207DRAFT_267390 [Hyaloscypha variabilis F]